MPRPQADVPWLGVIQQVRPTRSPFHLSGCKPRLHERFVVSYRKSSCAGGVASRTIPLLRQPISTEVLLPRASIETKKNYGLEVRQQYPHLIHLRLRFTRALHVPGHLSRVQRVQQSGIHRLQRRGFLLEFTQHSIGTDMQGSRRIAHSTGIETHVDDRLFDFRQAPAVAIVKQKTALGTEGVLTEVALGAPGRFAAFDDLITLTVRAADRDERHGPFLPKSDYEDKGQSQ